MRPNIAPSLLVVDDVRGERELFAEFLGPAGMRVTMAGGGLAALATVRDTAPDLIVTVRRSSTFNSSKSISTMDLPIATTALDAGAPLPTGNRRHFEVVPDLVLMAYR